MFSSSLGRLVRATWPAATPSTAPSSCPLARAAAAARPAHQRRQSSSKAPRSPEVRGAVPSQQQGESRRQQQPPSSRQSRIGRRRAKTSSSAQQVNESFSDLPSVPPTNHLHPLDVNLSSFFSLHRPISITHPLPSSSSASSFDRIFEGRKDEDPLAKKQQQYNQLKTTLESLGYYSHHYQNFQSNSSSAAFQAAPEPVVHLDGASLSVPSLDQALSMMPFRAPPVPQPGAAGISSEDRPSSSDADSLHASHHAALLPHHSTPKRRNFRATIKRKYWETTVTVTETTDHHGRKSYEATNSPIVRVAVPVSTAYLPGAGAGVEEPTSMTAEDEEGRAIAWRQPFLQRMWIRQQESLQRRRRRISDWSRMMGQKSRGQMLLISVRRQRKLKIKKKKHKKLLKRTRNLRRKLGRA